MITEQIKAQIWQEIIQDPELSAGGLVTQYTREFAGRHIEQLGRDLRADDRLPCRQKYC
jgi:hypothetical protein